ncbi:unnamed protein product [Ambrosiozyma monospora]|uniref:Unnamed protein product n=1 Tax=Ambrosiozyma monospora TaxID=43982 RepID=A0ACB5T885_AMBMO|nr:unnamed protein product [Ambrosiozyma monospora]
MFRTQSPWCWLHKNLYGLSAPTISTTLCLTLLDAVSIALSELHVNDLNARKKRFGERHPGGAIGLNYLQGFQNSKSNVLMNSLTTSNNDGSSSSGGFSNLSNKSASEMSSSFNEETSSTTTPPNLIIEETEDGSEVGDDGILDLGQLQLLQDVKMSESKISLDNLPTDEFALIQLITMYDYLLVTNGVASHVLESKAAQTVYRKCKLQEDSWNDIQWKINDCLIELNI